MAEIFPCSAQHLCSLSRCCCYLDFPAVGGYLQWAHSPMNSWWTISVLDSSTIRLTQVKWTDVLYTLYHMCTYSSRGYATRRAALLLKHCSIIDDVYCLPLQCNRITTLVKVLRFNTQCRISKPRWMNTTWPTETWSTAMHPSGTLLQ